MDLHHRAFNDCQEHESRDEIEVPEQVRVADKREQAHITDNASHTCTYTHTHRWCFESQTMLWVTHKHTDNALSHTQTHRQCCESHTMLWDTHRQCFESQTMLWGTGSAKGHNSTHRQRFESQNQLRATTTAKGNNSTRRQISTHRPCFVSHTDHALSHTQTMLWVTGSVKGHNDSQGWGTQKISIRKRW